MKHACVVFDFDGTLTDLEGHAPALHDVSQECLAQLLGISKTSIRERWDDARAALDTTPIDTAWERDGHKVASLRSDVYVWANAITRSVLLATMSPTRCERELDSLVYEVHRAGYEQARAPFRKATREVLDALCARGKQVFVVTNSDGATVGRQLDQLRLRARDRVIVHGHAGKFLICEPREPSDEFAQLPSEMHVENMNRPVLLRRGQYYDALRHLWHTHGGSAASSLVCGDIFEIDLALPAALGASVHLATRSTTLEHERQAALSHPRGGADDDLRAVLERVS